MAALFVVDFLELVEDFVLGLVAQLFEVGDGVDALFEEEFDVVVVVEDSVFELLN